MNKDQKTQLVESLVEKFKNSSALYFTKYTGMGVEQATELRSDFKDNDSEYFISKNTLTKLAIEKSGLDNKLFDDYLSGQVGIVYAGNDPTAPARVIKKFSESNECLEVIGLYFDGEIYEPSKYKQLADLPSKEELLTKIVCGLNSPMTKVVFCLQSPMSNLVNVLNSLKASKN